MTSPVVSGAQGDDGRMDDETPSARPICEHHWASKHQPDFPPEIFWVEICSMCGDVNGAGLARELGDTRARLAAVEAACACAEREYRPGTVAAEVATVFVHDIRAALGATDQAGDGG